MGVRIINHGGTCDDALAFLIPDGETIILLRHEPSNFHKLQAVERAVVVHSSPNFNSTLSIKPA